MNLWSCLAPEGQSDRRDFTKSLMLWFVFSNKAASLISILADLWETARAMELAYWRWVFIQNTFPMPLSDCINISTFVFCWLFSGEGFWLFCYLFQQAYYIYFMDLTSEPSPCESKLARKDHTVCYTQWHYKVVSKHSVCNKILICAWCRTRNIQ